MKRKSNTSARAKKPEVEEDDVIRRFVTFHVKETEKALEVEMTAKERSDVVDTLVNFQGDALVEHVRGAAAMLIELQDDGPEGDGE